MKNNRDGYIAEFIARVYMVFHGYRIVAKNIVTGKGTHCGEIDFIACKGRSLVFVEVKKRNSMEDAFYAIKPMQQQRIKNGALAFIKKNPQFRDYDLRFDAILVSFPLQIQHIANAWQ